MPKGYELDARLCQVAYSSKHWSSRDEWESVHVFTWKVIEALKLTDGTADPEADSEASAIQFAEASQMIETRKGVSDDTGRKSETNC